MVVDLLPYDASLGEATVQLRSEEGFISIGGCLSAIWVGNVADKCATAEWITKSTISILSADVTSGRSSVPGADGVGVARDVASFGAAKPVLDLDKFKHSRPMSDGTLRLFQSLHTLWGEDPQFKIQFDALANSHNSKFNPSGVPFKENHKRTADEMGSHDDSAAVSLSGEPGVPTTKAAVLEAHSDIVQIMGHSPSFELLVSKDGCLYMHGLEDSIVSNELGLCGCGDGVFDLGTAAQKTKSTDSGKLNYVSFISICCVQRL
jgi:hypothetical protein